MEIVAVPADRQSGSAWPPENGGSQSSAGDTRSRTRARATQRLEKNQLAAFIALQAVSSYSETDVELPEFFGRLSEIVAGLVKARRMAFWRLGPHRTLAVQPKPYGFATDSPIHTLRVRLPAGSESVAERVVFRDEFELVKGTTPDLDEWWEANGLVGIRNSIAVCWRAGNRRIGTLVAYDSRRGFSSDDAWVLRVAAMAMGLMWQYREAEQKLDVTAERLEQAAAARRQLLGNIAAGGDEARRRFASTLHDDSLQLLTAAELQLERIQTDADPNQQGAQLDQLKSTLRKVEESLRRLLLNVSAKATDVPLGLDEAIHMRLESLRTRSGIETDIDLRLPSPLSPAVESVIFKNLAEALTNAEKHALATKIKVSAYPTDGGIRVVVTDDGKGFVVAESIYVPGHLGLVAMRERALLAGGRCHIDSEPGAGARVEFWVPINQ